MIALVAQKTKTANETGRSFDKIFTIHAPKKLMTDKGGEFKGYCNSIYEKYDIEHYWSQDVTQA